MTGLIPVATEAKQNGTLERGENVYGGRTE